MGEKEHSIRVRTQPRLTDFSYILTKRNLQLLQKYCLRKKFYRIVDLGCGYKPFQKILEWEEYIGVDVSPETSDADYFIDLNTNPIPLEKECADLVILSEVLEHLYRPLHALQEAARICKKEGLVFITTPFIFPEHGSPYDFYRYTANFYQKSLPEVGLKILEIQYSTSIFSAPLISFNLVLELLPFFPRILKAPLFFLTNSVILAVEVAAKLIAILLKKHPKINKIYSTFPFSIALVATKPK